MPPVPITAVKTPEQIRAEAAGQVDTEIQGQVTPIQSQADATRARERAVLEAISKMFGGLQTHADSAAQAVQGSYDAASQSQAAIFSGASQRLNELHQQRAQQAQALAQQMGGPVAVGDFTDAVDPAQTSLAYLGAGSMLHTLGYAQAGVQEANDWAGKVFPLVQTEETAKARTKYEEEIKGLEDQITAAKASRSSKINAKANEMLIREREYALQKAQQGLDKLKANRDWQATLRTLRNDETRIDMAKAEFDLRKGEVLGKVDGKDTLQMKQLTAQQQQNAAALGLSTKEYQLRLRDLNQSTKLANKKYAAAQKVTWASYLDAAVNPQPGKNVTITSRVPIDAIQAIKDKNAFADPSSPTGYSKFVKTEQTMTTDPITDPNDLYDYLTSHQVPKQVAINMIKQRLGIRKDWKPGQDPTIAGKRDRG